MKFLTLAASLLAFASDSALPTGLQDARTAVARNAKLMTAAELQALPSKVADARYAYGKEADQFGELRVPAGTGPHPVVILVHGGCWRAKYSTLRDLAPMADAFKEMGVATWNVEYRRLGEPGGGWPGTYLDIGMAVDSLRSIARTYSLDLERVIVIGHSAGGHLAMWAAARRRLSPTSDLYVRNPLPLHGVINLAGTADMESFLPAEEQGCQGDVVEQMMGGKPSAVPRHYADTSARGMVPLGLREVTIWGGRDEIAPVSLGESYTAAAKQAGDPVRLMIFPALGHFEIASPGSSAWPSLVTEIRSMLGR